MSKRLIETTYTRTGPIPIDEFEEFVARAIAGARSAGFTEAALVRASTNNDPYTVNTSFDGVILTFVEEK